MTTWRRGAIASASAALLVAAGAVPALAATTTQQKQQQAQIGQKLSQLRSQANEVSGQEADLLGRLDDVNNRKAALDAQITDLEKQMADVQTELDGAQSQLDQAQQQQDQAQASLDEARAELAASTEKMRQQAIDAYVGDQSNQNLTSFILKAEDMRQVSAASEYLNQIVQDRRTIVEEHRELEGRANDLAKQMEDARAQAQATRDTIAARQDQLASQKGQLDALHAQADADAANQTALLGEIEQKKVDIAGQMADLQHQSDSIAASLRGLGGGGTAPPPGKGVLAIPAPGAPLTSPFGMRLDPVTGVYQLHAGQDFGVSTGTPIHAAADGTVVTLLAASQSGGYGNYTCISHGGGLATCYAHQSQFLVASGQHVARNQVIGLAGSTGYSTGPHLHFEVRINGTPVNPLPYL